MSAENLLLAVSFEGVATGVLIAYLILLLVLGYVGYRRSTASEEDFYLAGRGQSWIVSSLTIMATFFSSFALLGAPGLVYKEGVAFALFALNVPFGAMVIYVVGRRISRLGRLHGYVTPGDLISAHYGESPTLRILVAIVGCLYAIPYIVMQMNAGGIVTVALFPDSDMAFTYGTTALALITTLYVLIGGMRSVAWTDVIQGVLLISGMLLAGAAAVAALGGVGGFLDGISNLPKKSLSLPGTSGSWPSFKMFTICTIASLGSMIQPAQWMRYYAANSPGTLRRSALTFGTVLPFAFLFGVMLVGLGGQALYPLVDEAGNYYTNADGKILPNPAVGDDPSNFDRILVVVLKNHLPELLGVAGIFLASLIGVAIMAAAMSTADSNLHALSAVFTRDVYSRFLRPQSSQRERAWVGRVVIVASTLVALGLIAISKNSEHFNPIGLIAQMGFLAIAFSTQLLPVTIDILFVRRGTRQGAIAGTAAGLLVMLFFTPLGTILAPAATDTLTSIRSQVDLGAFALIANVAAFVLVSKWTKR